MTQENIEAFLSVVYNGSFSKAASSLYSTQTTISRHIKQLEDFLGYPLFIRGQGQRAVQLTPQGRDFLPLAERWRTLLNISLSLNSPKNYRAPLFIAAADRLNYFFLPKFYREFNQRHPEIFFNNLSFHSITIIEKVKTGELDAGFISVDPMVSGFNAHLFYEDKLVMLCQASGYYKPGPIHPKNLLPENEIRITPDIQIQQWYSNWWNFSVQPHTMIDTVNMIPLYMTEPHYWTICPRYAAEALMKQGNFEIHEISVATPKQSAYFIYNKNSFASKPALEVFVNEFISSYSNIKSI